MLLVPGKIWKRNKQTMQCDSYIKQYFCLSFFTLFWFLFVSAEIVIKVIYCMWVILRYKWEQNQSRMPSSRAKYQWGLLWLYRKSINSREMVRHRLTDTYYRQQHTIHLLVSVSWPPACLISAPSTFMGAQDILLGPLSHLSSPALQPANSLLPVWSHSTGILRKMALKSRVSFFSF